jgi:hypothetical protein
MPIWAFVIIMCASSPLSFSHLMMGKGKRWLRTYGEIEGGALCDFRLMAFSIGDRAIGVRADGNWQTRWFGVLRTLRSASLLRSAHMRGDIRDGSLSHLSR